MLTEHQIKERFIPFSSLRYTTDAFIDYRIPGCGPKKNYALIGPGVSERKRKRERKGQKVVDRER